MKKWISNSHKNCEHSFIFFICFLILLCPKSFAQGPKQSHSNNSMDRSLQRTNIWASAAGQAMAPREWGQSLLHYFFLWSPPLLGYRYGHSYGSTWQSSITSPRFLNRQKRQVLGNWKVMERLQRKAGKAIP